MVTGSRLYASGVTSGWSVAAEQTPERAIAAGNRQAASRLLNSACWQGLRVCLACWPSPVPRGSGAMANRSRRCKIYERIDRCGPQCPNVFFSYANSCYDDGAPLAEGCTCAYRQGWLPCVNTAERALPITVHSISINQFAEHLQGHSVPYLFVPGGRAKLHRSRRQRHFTSGDQAGKP